ncbi:MAG TPA: hypothetical protein VN711_01370, partial [Candidatus Saccharimonadales bacterium]|nr:hypothetical protein [Candidatus Saccharimonadales bacterium]
MKIEALHNQNIAILGLGMEGIKTAQYLLEHGISFSVLDEKTEKELEHGGEDWKQFLKTCKTQKIPLILGNEITKETLLGFDIVV